MRASTNKNMKYFSKIGIIFVIIYIFSIFTLTVISPKDECVAISGYSSCPSSSIISENGTGVWSGRERSVFTSALIILLKPWIPLNYVFPEGLGLFVVVLNASILYILGLVFGYFTNKMRSRRVVPN